MKCKFYAQKGNEQKERDTSDRFNLTGLDSYLLEFTTRNLRGFVLKILKIMLFSKQNLLLNNTLGHKTLKELPTSRSLNWSQKTQFCFQP